MDLRLFYFDLAIWDYLLQNCFFSITRKRSLINKLNNNGPKINPCGTPLTISTVQIVET